VKRWRFVPLYVGLTAAFGCGDPIAPFDGVYDFRAVFETGDTVRSAVVHVPPAYTGTRTLPLLLAFHGFGGSGEGLRGETELDAVADRLSFIVAYPDGNPGWDVEPDKDVLLTHDLIDYLGRRLGIARRRIYAVGFSAGGSFTMRLACEEAGRFAAVGIVGATVYENRTWQCDSTARITTALVLGTVDALVPFEGSFGRFSADSTARFFARRNGCDLTARTVEYEPDLVNDGRRVRRESFDGCRDGTETVLWVVEGGTHTWYRGDVDTGMLLAGLFLRHQR